VPAGRTLILHVDGGARGNPGPAAIGVVISEPGGGVVEEIAETIGRATNNVAEYKALITGLEKARDLGARKLIIRGDSELIIKQMRGEYRVKHPDLKGLYDEAQFLYHQFDEAKIEHNYRDKNTLADRLANLAMDRKGDVTDAQDDPVAVPAPVQPKAGDRFHCARCGCAIELRQPSRIRPHQLRAFTCQCGAQMDAR
jgi:ribonuclease HI